MIECDLVELEPQTLLAVRGELPLAELPGLFDRAFSRVMEVAGRHGCSVTGPPVGYYPELPGELVVVEAGFPVDGPGVSDGDVHPVTLPGGRAVETVHVGPYDTMAATYEQLQAWLTEHELVPTAGMWECYLSEPTGDPAQWRTRIVCPVSERLPG